MRGFILFSLLSVATTDANIGQDNLAPLFKSKDSVPDSYIVKFKDGISSTSFDSTLASITDNSHHVYKAAFKGFSATLDSVAIRNLRRHPDVCSLES